MRCIAETYVRKYAFTYKIKRKARTDDKILGTLLKTNYKTTFSLNN